MKALILFVLFTTSVFAIPEYRPSRSSCNYYYEVEREYKCGKDGYALKFGRRLCQRYLDVQSEMPQRVQNWFPKIRYCLQKFIEDQRGSIRGCSDLHRKAIDSHIGCYLSTGFCNLSVTDQASILRVTGADIFHPDVIGLSVRVQAACALR